MWPPVANQGIPELAGQADLEDQEDWGAAVVGLATAEIPVRLDPQAHLETPALPDLPPQMGISL